MLARRLLPFVASLFVCLAATAATVEERSPFTQGHWWDPTRSGHGFELLNAGGQVFMVWYTYKENGAPTWYTAQGDESSLGDPWPLMSHEWSGGRIVRSTNVGYAQLRRRHTEKLDLVFDVGGRSGQWSLEPFRQSGVINEVDLSGHWYNPAASGWGMTLLDQGDVFGAVIYAYDAAGAPTWVAGFDRGKGTRIDLYSTRGTCPACPYQAITTSPAGSIRIDYRGDTEITIRGAPTVAFAPGVVIDGTRAAQLGRPASTRRVDYQIAPFGTEKALKEFLVAGMSNRTFGSSGSDFSASPPAGPPSFSLTNTQEAGVDEADVVKTDGRHIYSMLPISYTGATTSGYTQKVRIVDVGPAGSLLQPVGEFSLYRDPYAYNADSGLYLHAGNLTTVASAYYYGGWYISPPEGSQTHIEVFGLSNPAAPDRRWRARVSGSMVSSRRIGDRLYLVTRFTPSIPGYQPYAWTEAQRAQNAALLADAPLDALLPRVSVNDAPAVPLVQPGTVHAPQLGGNVAVADMVVVTVIDLRDPRVLDSLAIVGRSEAIYVSTSNLYLASSRYSFTNLTTVPQGNLYNTDIHQVRIGGERLQYVGSGSIEGFVGWGDKASFRFGEHDGRLAVVSSLFGWWGNSNSNRVTVLEPSATAPGLLKTVSVLPNAQRPQPLGKPNERVYGTRFVGDKLYAVTFRQVDPLYIVDLSNKADPRITGELELPGFSDYLHPLPNGLLLGFGMDATATGFFQGLQMSLFDVSGAAPRLVDQVQVGKRGSASALFSSHHAFSALPRADGSTVVAFPAAVHDGAPPAQEWSYFPYQFSGLLRYEVRGATPQTARLVALPSLVTDRGNGTDTYYYNQNTYDERWGKGRSVLFQDSSYYMGNGKFWRLDNATGDTIGPY